MCAAFEHWGGEAYHNGLKLVTIIASAISVAGQGNVNIGGRFFAMSQISAHPLVWAQSKVQRPWALFRETMVYSR